MKIKSAEKRQQILDAAYDVFREQGFEAATMAHIASRIGGSKATLYNHFADKDNLFVDVMLALAQRLKKESPLVFDIGLPLAERLQVCGVNYLRFVLSPEMLDMRRIVIAQAKRSQIGIQVYERGAKIGWQKIADQLATFMQKGELRREDPWLVAMHLRGLIEADIYEPALLGLDIDTSTENLRGKVAVAVAIFLRAYGA